jgi:hypothetical protein
MDGWDIIDAPPAQPLHPPAIGIMPMTGCGTPCQSSPV